MSNIDRSVFFSLGLVLGVAVATAISFWSFPWFSYPTFEAVKGIAENGIAPQNSKELLDAYLPAFIKSDDSLAQWLMTAFALAATLISIWAVVLIRQTLIETARAADITQTAFLNDQRPWIDFKLTSFRYLRDDNQTVLMLRFDIRNIGKSPAYGVRIGTASTGKLGNLTELAYQALDNIDGNLIESPIVLMGDNVFIGHSMVLKNTEFEAFQDGFKPIDIVIVFTYNNVAGVKDHVTAKTFLLEDKESVEHPEFGNVRVQKAISFAEERNRFNEIVRETVLSEQDGRRDYR